MKIELAIITLLLTACATASPTPEQCRQHGVLIPDGSEVRGVVVEELYVTPQKAQALCQSPFEARRGCAMVVFPGWQDQPSEWLIVYTDEVSRVHETCHSLWETREHTAP